MPIAAIAVVGLAAASAAGAFTPDAPDVTARNIGKETRDTLQAQIDLAPDQYAVEAEYGPKYAKLEQDKLEMALTGKVTGKGYLPMYEDELMPASNRISAKTASDQRAADIADVEKYGPRATAAFKAANPEVASMDDALSAQIMKLISAGGTLDPAEERQLQQGIRSTQAARGMGYGTSDAIGEAVGLDRASEGRRIARLNTGMNYISGRYSRGADPFMAILGRSSASPAMAAAATASGQASVAGSGVSSQFDPFNAYANDLHGTNANAYNASAITSANNQAAMTGAGLSMLGSGLGSYYGSKGT